MMFTGIVKRFFFSFLMEGAYAMLLYFLINSHCSRWRYIVLLGAKETRGHFLVSPVFIWVGGLSEDFLVSKVGLLSSDSSSWVSLGMNYWGRKQIGKSRENW
jgi:hypothetical protein